MGMDYDSHGLSYADFLIEAAAIITTDACQVLTGDCALVETTSKSGERIAILEMHLRQPGATRSIPLFRLDKNGGFTVDLDKMVVEPVCYMNHGNWKLHLCYATFDARTGCTRSDDPLPFFCGQFREGMRKEFRAWLATKHANMLRLHCEQFIMAPTNDLSSIFVGGDELAVYPCRNGDGPLFNNHDLRLLQGYSHMFVSNSKSDCNKRGDFRTGIRPLRKPNASQAISTIGDVNSSIDLMRMPFDSSDYYFSGMTRALGLHEGLARERWGTKQNVSQSWDELPIHCTSAKANFHKQKCAYSSGVYQAAYTNCVGSNADMQDALWVAETCVHVESLPTRQTSNRQQLMCYQKTLSDNVPPPCSTLPSGEQALEWACVLGTLTPGVFSDPCMADRGVNDADKWGHPNDIPGRVSGDLQMDQFVQNDPHTPCMGPFSDVPSKYYSLRHYACNMLIAVLANCGRTSLAVNVPRSPECHKIASFGSGVSHCAFLFCDNFLSLFKMRWLDNIGNQLTWDSRDLARPRFEKHA